MVLFILFSMESKEEGGGYLHVLVENMERQLLEINCSHDDIFKSHQQMS